MPLDAHKNTESEEILNRFEVDRVEAEIVKPASDSYDSVRDEIVPLVQALIETDFKDTSFIKKGDDTPELRQRLANKKLSEIQSLISRRQILFVRINGKIVAMQALIEKAKLSDGRPLLELTKGATLDEFRGKNIAVALASSLISSALESDADVVISSFSRNPIVIDAFRRNGWNILDSNSSNPVAKAYAKGVDVETAKTLQKDGYKVIYLDPKNKISPEDIEEVSKTRALINKLLAPSKWSF